MQGSELRIGGVKMITQERNEGNDHLPGGKVDKIHQSKYSKEANLLRIERSGLC